MNSESLEDLIQKWLLWDKDETSAAEIRSLCEKQAQLRPISVDAEEELKKRLRTRIQFGTAGLRGRMQAGFAFMNCLTVIQTSQGIAKYLLSSATADGPLFVIIGHDTRHNSARFARLAANAFRSRGIQVEMFEDYVATPLVAFGVKTRRANAGIMITASHNPAQDNGYKVYQSNGAQINTPVDTQIAKSIMENLEPWEGAWDESKFLQNPPSLLSALRERYSRQLLSRHYLVGHLILHRTYLTFPDQNERNSQFSKCWRSVHTHAWCRLGYCCGRCITSQ
jgi:phosphoglucomutase